MIKNFIISIINNVFKSGLVLALFLTLLEYISQYKSLVNFYSFFSGSFIIVNLFQFNTIFNENIKATKSFLIHSIIGGIVWVIYAFYMYYAYINNVDKNIIIFSTFIIFIILSCIYYYLCVNNYI